MTEDKKKDKFLKREYDLEVIRTKYRKLKTVAIFMRDYVMHKIDCETLHARTLTYSKCSCGLRELLIKENEV